MYGLSIEVRLVPNLQPFASRFAKSMLFQTKEPWKDLGTTFSGGLLLKAFVLTGEPPFRGIQVRTQGIMELTTLKPKLRQKLRAEDLGYRLMHKELCSPSL